jgi:hypothetical protein
MNETGRESLANQKSDEFSNDNENDESQISDDTLKNKCLTIKVTVQLEVLDITKLSRYAPCLQVFSLIHKK